MFGLAEFVAAEEMDRTRGYWWAPDGTAVLVARVDETPVQRWHIADPANPGRVPREVGYPSAGTPNADVSLVCAGLDGSRAPLDWDRAAFPYLVTVNWDGTDPLIVVQSRDQRRMRLLSADAARGATAVLREDTDARWLDIVPGVPGWTGDGRIVWTADAEGARRLLVAAPAELTDGTAAPVTPAELQVRGSRTSTGTPCCSPRRTRIRPRWPSGPTARRAWPGSPRNPAFTRAGVPAGPPCSSAVRWARPACR